MSLDLSGPPCCPDCGEQLTEHEHPEPGEPTWYSYRCVCGWEWYDREERVTYRTAPWTQRLAAEIDRLTARLTERAP